MENNKLNGVKERGMKEKENKMSVSFLSKSENEAFGRSVVAAFCAQVNPKLDELNDVKTAVSEAITNSIVHGYLGKNDGRITINVYTCNNLAKIEIIDEGTGITDINKAREPFFTTKGDDRSGMGFTVMESFMDDVIVENNEKGKGVSVVLTKTFTKEAAEEHECKVMKKQLS